MGKRDKRFYWVKMCEDFFERDEIKIIECLEKGNEFIVFYLKLLLKSVGNNGKLMIRGTIPYSNEMLAKVTGKTVAFVEESIGLFLSFGLIEVSEAFEGEGEHYYISDIENMTGSETGHAKEKREKRRLSLKEEERASVFCGEEGDNVSENHSNCLGEKRDESLEFREESLEKREEIKEKREEIKEKREESKEMRDEREEDVEELRVREVLKGCNFPPQSLTVISLLLKDYEVFGEDWVNEALRISSRKGIRKYSYVKKILEKWVKEGKWSEDLEEEDSLSSKYSKPIEGVMDFECKY